MLGIRQAHLTAPDPPRRLKHYVKILKAQLGELELEIQRRMISDRAGLSKIRKQALSA